MRAAAQAVEGVAARFGASIIRASVYPGMLAVETEAADTAAEESETLLAGMATAARDIMTLQSSHIHF